MCAKPVDTDSKPVHALLFIANGCPHCPTMLQQLTDLLESGKLSKLEVINLSVDPEPAEQLGIRSVPWLRLGQIELEGMRSKSELEQWLQQAGSLTGQSRYLEELLTAGKLDKARQTLRKCDHFAAILELLLGNDETELQVRIGLGALIEELCQETWFADIVPVLGRLVHHKDARIRNDSCYYLGLVGTDDVVPLLSPCLQDEDKDVRETAREALAEIQNP